LEYSFLFCLLKLLGTGCADDKKRWVPAPLRGMDDGPGQGWLDWHYLAVVMKSFSKTDGKWRANRRARPAEERSVGSLLPHSMRLGRMSCLPAFIIDF
jgi:hypothetical protein